MDRVDRHQLLDDARAGRPNQGGLLRAPGGGAHVEGDLLRRVMLEIGGPAGPRQQRVGGHHPAAVQDLHMGAGGPGIDLLPDQPPRHRIQPALADQHMAVDADLPDRPHRQLEVGSR
jgi:hypothetical protein